VKTVLNSVWIKLKEEGFAHDVFKAELLRAFGAHGIHVDMSVNPPDRDFDFCLCLGGDGTLLSTLRRLGEARHEVPVLGIHLSRGLGFLYSLQLPSENHLLAAWCDRLLLDILDSNYTLDERYGLSLSIPEFSAKNASESAVTSWAMNDFVFAKSGSLSRMVYLRVWVDGGLLFHRMRGDGLIVASATGSTGYSLSAGGPVIEPTLDAIILNPVCPHEVAQRPIVLAGSSTVKIEILHEKNADCTVSSDGQEKVHSSNFNVCEIRRSPKSVKWVRMLHGDLNPKSYFEQLRSKLRYGGD